MKFKFIDADKIMLAVVAIIILAVGIYAFFVTVANVPQTTPFGSNSTGTNAGASTMIQNATYYALKNASSTGNSVFNIVGVVLILAAIMMIIGVVYSYVKPRY